MQQWLIEGADNQTGEEVRVVLPAIDQAAAEALARAKGILIAKISLIPGSLPATESPAHSDRLPFPQPIADSVKPGYATPWKTPAQPTDGPGYRSLIYAGKVANIATILFYVLAGTYFFLAAYSMLVLPRFGGLTAFPFGLERLLQQILFPIALGAVGAFFHVLSAACLALRDIARNSFNW